MTLDPVTRRDAASSFFGEANVPFRALTMGVGTILEARKIAIMAFGEHKASIVRRAVEGEVTDAIAASFLQNHADTTFLLDEAAAAELTAVSRPWTLGLVDWTPSLIRRAVIWLSLTVQKGLLKLSDEDFRENAAGKVVIPGLINGHTHVPMTLFRGIADDLDLQEWLTKYIFPAEAKNVTEDFVRVGTRLGLAEMIRSGFSSSALIPTTTSSAWVEL